MIPSSSRQVYQALRALIDDVRQLVAGATSTTAALQYAFVYRPGAVGPQPPNTFTTWPALYAAMTKIPGPKLLEVDGSLVGGTAHVPAGAWIFTDMLFLETHDFATSLNFDNGATLYAPNLVNFTLQLTSTSAAPVFVYRANTFVLIAYSGGVAALGAAAFFEWPVAADGTSILELDTGSALGFGTATLTVDAGAHMFGTVSAGSFVASGAIVGLGNASLLVSPDSAIGGPQPVATQTIATTDINFLQELDTAGIGAAATIAQNSTGTITRFRGGVVRVEVQATVLQGGGAAGKTTFQITRDGAPLAASPTASMDIASAATGELSISWLDTLPDFLPHHYGWTASTSAGTIALAGSQGKVSVREDG